MDIDLIPQQQTEQKSLWRLISLYLSVFLLIVSVAASLVFLRINRGLDEKVTAIDTELVKGKTAKEIEAENQVLSSQKKVSAFSQLLQLRKPVTEILDLLGENIHPQIIFNKIDFSAKDNSVFIAGLADNFQVLGQQALLFKKNSFIESVNLENIGIEKTGGVGFSFEIIFKPEIF